MSESEMDVKIDRARSLHRVVRSLHDGHCPKCAAIFEASRAIVHFGERCPECGFAISDDEARAAVAEFAPIMQKSLAVFEQWRAELYKS